MSDSFTKLASNFITAFSVAKSTLTSKIPLSFLRALSTIPAQWAEPIPITFKVTSFRPSRTSFSSSTTS